MKSYLQNEIDLLNKDNITKNRGDYTANRLLILLITLLICGYCYSTSNVSNESYITRAFFPQTWECVRCKYRNYEGIKHCAICGKERKN
jgi:hypothetical protein